MVTAAIEGLVLSPNTLVYGWAIGVVGATILMDSFLVRAVEPLVGSNLIWKRHYLPSGAIMNVGASLTLAWGYDQSTTLLIVSWILVVGGFLATLNQLTDGTILEEKSEENGR
jgi:hypothetical protein